MKYSSNVLAFIIFATLISSICYEIYFSFKKDGERLSLRTFSKLQLIKIAALYLLFDLIVFDYGGWKLDIGNWGRSLFGVFVMSILFGYVIPVPDQYLSWPVSYW